MDSSILIVDDSVDTLELLQRKLKKKNYQVTTAGNVNEALHLLSINTYDLVITDYKMPKLSGLELIRHIRENYRQTRIIMITGYPTIDGAVEAVKTGAEEYLTKPFTDDELFTAVSKAFARISEEESTLKTPVSNNCYGLIGDSEVMHETYSQISKSSKINATVLIQGESGTGKELVARAIHYNSNRSSYPFMPVNCGAIPENLLESELFGHVKGAFTGAYETKAGFFLTADNGTIFLDEIGEMSLSMQVRLLRVLQEKEITMIGSNNPRKINIRIIAATNKDLQKLVEKGSFREDLFYRLNVIRLTLPPLRDRDNDILLLANHFTQKYAKEIGKKLLTFSEFTLRAFKQYYWPGNVRELENIIQRLVFMTDHNHIDITDLPEPMRYSLPKEDTELLSLKDLEKKHVQKVLNAVNGNKSKAASILGIDRKTLRVKLNELTRIVQ